MAEEMNKLENQDVNDLSEFAADDADLAQFAVEEAKKEIVLPEDLNGFAKEFPAWDLHPPKDVK